MPGRFGVKTGLPACRRDSISIRHLPHLYDHDVDEETGEDRAGCDGSRIALGQTASGRYFCECSMFPIRRRIAFLRSRPTHEQASRSRHSQAKKEETTNEPRQISNRMGRGESVASVCHYALDLLLLMSLDIVCAKPDLCRMGLTRRSAPTAPASAANWPPTDPKTGRPAYFVG